MNPLLKWFFVWLAVVVSSVAVYSFFGPKAKKIDVSVVEYSTTSSSEIYFKNIRSFYYELEEDSASQFNIYRLKKWKRLEDDFSLVIIHNWLMSESYIMVEVEKQLINKELALIFRNGKEEKN